jgi:hypothetical protein
MLGGVSVGGPGTGITSGTVGYIICGSMGDGGGLHGVQFPNASWAIKV